MRATLMYGAGDVRVETVPDARLVEPTDALVAVTRAAICGSDLWPYKSMEPSETGRRMGHEFIGVVEAVGDDVRTVKAGDVVVAPFAVVRRHVRLLPRGAAHLVPPRRLLRLRRRRRRPGRGGARATGGRNARRRCRSARTTR